MRRRPLLAGLAAVTTLGASGCIGSAVPEEFEEAFTRGQAEAVPEAHREVEEKNVEYLGDGTVEIVIKRAQGEPYETITQDFDEWAERRTMRVAKGGVYRYFRELAVEELDYDFHHYHGYDHGRPFDASVEPGVIVTYLGRREDSDVVTDIPPIDFDTFVEFVPATCNASIVFEGNEFDWTGPVWAKKTTTAPDKLA